MRRSTRLIAGIFALVAMSFSIAETAWASTCAPAMDMATSEATVAEEVLVHDCLHGTVDDRKGENSGEDERPCPFSPAAAQGCAGVASLPTHAVDGLAVSPEAVSALFFELTQHDLLLQEVLFHPPRA